MRYREKGKNTWDETLLFINYGQFQVSYANKIMNTKVKTLIVLTFKTLQVVPEQHHVMKKPLTSSDVPAV